MLMLVSLIWGAMVSGAGAALLPAGNHVLSVRVANDTVVHVPEASVGRQGKVPVVLALHGLGENYPGNFQKEIQLDQVADREGFVTVYPLGSKSWSVPLFGHTWNGGNCCFTEADDEDFLRHVITSLPKWVNVDPNRIYALGFSSGGVMAHRLACNSPDLVAAVVSVDGPIEVKKACTHAKPVAHFHGRLDPVFPYSGAIFNGATQTIEAWVKTDGCDKSKKIEKEVTSTVKSTLYNSCANGTEVQLVQIEFGGHAWPPKAMNPNEYMWSWLSRWNRTSTHT
mmetsp:Transcript_6829/g.12521  ORF Transcript_6829/g.12521 Transcript_6829/m.12521 type:complete len:282 (+) Transcript_6829:30-875(+)